MIFKIWQCIAHKDLRQKIGITYTSIDVESEDCPFCIINEQQIKIKEQRSKIHQLESELQDALIAP